MALAIRIKGPNGSTAMLDNEQLQIVNQTLTDMMNGKVSVKLVNDIVIQKLKDAGKPLDFGDDPCNTEPD